ncbi:MAG: hypothetical protein IPK96_14390 [Flammeovirgaceae bacterium]|nr:hypothetical protein [Flammeovirgaceae bacterium]
MANIRLNILPIRENSFSFKIYRKLDEEDSNKEEGIYLYQLPETTDLKLRKRYLVSFAPKDGFAEYTAHSSHAIGLTRHFLTEQLLESLNSNGCAFPFTLYRKFAIEQVEFTINENARGRQIIFLSSYYFEELKRFGFIIDFRFSKNPDAPFYKDVQILSLNLDRNGRSNKNYYSDKYELIEVFLSKAYDTIKEIKANEETNLHIESELIETPVFQLNRKEYIFSNKSTANSQFQGIRNFGPFQKIENEALFVFIFEDRFKSFANELYLSLTGKSNPGTFSGFEAMFGVHIGTDNVRQIKIQGYSKDELLSIVDSVKSFKESEPQKKVIGIYIEDYSIDSVDSEASNHYYFLKYHFIKNNLPLQVVNYRKLGERNSLKWSTSNVAPCNVCENGGNPMDCKTEQ